MSRSLAEEIELLVTSVANNNPAPKKCVISKIYKDNHVDVDIKVGSEIGTIQYRPCLGNPKIDEEAVIIFVEGSINEGYVVCNTEEIEIVQSDWEQTDFSKLDYIKNKPYIPIKSSDLENDSEFINRNVSNLQNYYLKTEVDDSLNNKSSIIHTHTQSDITDFPSTIIMTVTFTDDTTKTYTIYGEEN